MTSEAEIEFEKANIFQEQGNFSVALTHLKKAISIDGNDPRYLISLGVCLSHLRHWKEAIKAFKAGIQLKPAYCEADARCMLADVLLKDGRKDEAEKEWEYVLNMEPSYPSEDAPMNEAQKQLQTLKTKNKR